MLQRYHNISHRACGAVILLILTVLLSLALFFSPFEVTVGREAGPQQIRAWGPGLEGGIVGKPATFVVESVGTDVGVLGESLISLSSRQVYFWFINIYHHQTFFFHQILIETSQIKFH